LEAVPTRKNSTQKYSLGFDRDLIKGIGLKGRITENLF
jgi:hypothetical protein